MYTCRQFMCMSVFLDDKTEKESITNLICVYCVLLINMYCEKRKYGMNYTEVYNIITM